jgi:hypothetical protein
MAEFKRWDSYQRFAEEVRRDRRYFRSEESEAFIQAVLATATAKTSTMRAGFPLLWRAQHGCCGPHKVKVDDHDLEVFYPYLPERMKPRADKVGEGRANPKGVPYLYLATKRETAMSEVRPHIGFLISVAQFTAMRDLKIVSCADEKFRIFDLTFDEIESMENLGPERRERLVWGDINGAFSAPVERKDDVVDYIPTQILAEAFKYAGYDGIAYESSFERKDNKNKGYNVVLFDITAAEPDTPSLHRVKWMCFDFKEETFSGRPGALA